MTDPSAQDAPPPRTTRARVDTPEDLARIRSLVAQVTREAGIDGDRGGNLVLATNEVVSNALRHGTPPATITITTTPATVLVAVHDRGPRKPPTGHATPDGGPARHGPLMVARPGSLDPEQLNGRGLWLADHFCDRVQARTDIGGTTVTLTLHR